MIQNLLSSEENKTNQGHIGRATGTVVVGLKIANVASQTCLVMVLAAHEDECPIGRQTTGGGRASELGSAHCR
jgi:hypothetical protein